MAIKEKVAVIKGRKITEYSLTVDGKECEFKIQEPTFDQIAASLGQTKSNGNIDMIGCGKVIWELCCVSYSEEIKKNDRVLISLCVNLAEDYAMPIAIDLKKK